MSRHRMTTDGLVNGFFLCALLLLACVTWADKQKPAPKPSAPSKPAAQSAPRASQNAPNRGNQNGAPNRGGQNSNGNMSGQNGRGNQGGGMNNRGGMNNNNNRGGMNNNNNRGGMNNNNRGMNNNMRGGTNNRGEMNRGGMNNARGGVNNGRGEMNARGGMNASRRGPAVTNREIRTRSGATVHASFRGGHVRTIQAHNMRIDRGIHGNRRIVAERNGRRIVSMGPHRGYTQRAYYSHGGRVYVQRTYYVGGRRYAYAYRSYYYRGHPYYGYAPAYYYHPVYYGWAYNPWPRPVPYRWEYYNDPWYGHYAYYYQPYPVYPSAALWLTDYLIAESLRASYEAQQSGGLLPAGFLRSSQELAASGFSNDPLVNTNLLAPWLDALHAIPAAKSGTQLSPEAKEAIAEEVKSQIGDEKAAAENSSSSGGDNGPPAALDPNHHVFMVASEVDTSDDNGTDCSLTAGDIIYRTSDTPDDDNNVTATVRSSKEDDCTVGASVSIDADDLQEMHNHLRETLDAGLKDLASKQGKDGLPAAPDTTTTAGEVPAPAADTNVDNDLSQAQKDADQTEADVQNAGDSGGQQQ